jgi:hypothetical protein
MAPVSRDRSPLIISTLIALAAVVVLGVVLSASRSVPEPAPGPPPTAAEPEPESEPELGPEPPPPVEGDHEVVEVVDLSVTGSGLYRAGTGSDTRIGMDDGAVSAFAAAMAAWLDDHLTDLQDGGEGAAVGAGLTGPTEVVQLTDPQHPVASATYRVRIGARGAPEWGEVEVLVTRDDGSERTATLAFLPGEVHPLLIAAQGDGSAPDPDTADGPAADAGTDAEAAA